MSKYQVAVTIAAVLVFALHQRAWRDPELRSGLWVTGLVALLVFAPHLVWLRAHGFAPIDYAVESSLGARIEPAARVAASLHWLADQLFNRALAAILLLTWVAASAGRASPAPHGAPARADRAGAARALLLSWGLVPLVFMPLVGVWVGADLQLQWGTPFLLFVVPAAMELARPSAWAGVDLRKALMAFLVIQGVLLALSFLTSPRGPRALQARHWRNFDARLYAERIAPAARRELGGAIPVVIGPSSYAGALALALPEHPPVLIDARYDRSPWVEPDLVSRCGAVELGAMTDLADGRAVGTEFPGLAWRVVRPAAGAGPCPV